MAWGILEDQSGLTHVPGTSLLDNETSNGQGHFHALKKGTGRNSHIILVPQPSNDPNDPLNWPTWQKDLIFCLYCYCTLLCSGGIGPMLSSIAVVLIGEFKINFAKVSLLTGYSLCATGAAGIFISATAHKYGKRPTLIFSISATFAGTLWGGAASSYKSLVGARIIQGLGVSMFESVVYSVVGDLYFVHQRGSRMAIYATSTSGIANLPTMLSGLIAENLGWRWIFWLLSIFLGIAWILVILFGWETAFRRNALYDTDISSQNNIELIEELKGQTALHDELPDNSSVAQVITASSAIPRKSLIQRMNPLNGTFSDDSLLILIFRPFVILMNPSVIWAVLTLSFPVLWVVGISFVIAQIFAEPPFLLSTAQLGYLSAGPVIGGWLGCLFVGAVSDPIVKWISRKNGGLYEPEFRLVLVLGLVIFSALGYFLFGNLIVQGKSPAGMAAVWGVIIVTVQFAAIMVGTYMVDAYRNISVEVFIISMIFKNFLFFGFSFFLNDWIASWGPAKVFNIIGAIQLALCTLTIPVWIYGKRMRAWWHADNFVKTIM